MDPRRKTLELSRTYFDRLAKNYDQSRDGRFVKCMYGEIIRRAAALPGKRVLDLGCGNGNILLHLLKEREGEYYGVDISEPMILEAGKRLGDSAKLQIGDAAALPYDGEWFDVVICNASFHHYTEPERAVGEIRRVLKTGGTLILGDPTIPGALPLKLLNWLLRRRNSGDFRIYGKNEILQLFTKNGFRVEKWKRINYRCFVFHGVKVR